jgi:hypothetical protein
MKRAEIGYNPPASNQGDSHAGKFPPGSLVLIAREA